MNRLYVVLGGLLILGGIAAVIGQAFGLAAVLVVLGLALLVAEFRTNRMRSFVPLENGPDVGLERAKAQGLQNAQFGAGRPCLIRPRRTGRYPKAGILDPSAGDLLLSSGTSAFAGPTSPAPHLS